MNLATRCWQKRGTFEINRVERCEKGSHLPTYDDQETYFRELLKFIKDVNSTDLVNKMRAIGLT